MARHINLSKSRFPMQLNIRLRGELRLKRGYSSGEKDGTTGIIHRSIRTSSFPQGKIGTFLLFRWNREPRDIIKSKGEERNFEKRDYVFIYN